ncbi:MAG: hypothetical protein ACYDBB_12840 [Armatimonadota bacterium]
MRIQSVILPFLLLAFCATVALAKEWTITLTDYSGRGFAPDLVHYTVPMPVGGAGQFRLTGPDGKPLPVQVSPAAKAGQATVSFVAELPVNGTAIYRLRDDGHGETAPSAVQVVPQENVLLLANSLFAVLVPAEGEVKTNKALSAPILAFRQAGQQNWLGAGKLLLSKPVKSLRTKLVANGPVYTELRYELDFADGGYYHANIRVIDRVPLAMVTEEYDLGKDVGGNFWELNLTNGWTPDSVETMKAVGNGGYGQMNVTLADFVKGATPDKPFKGINPDNCWGFVPHSYIGLFTAAEQKAAGAYGRYPMAGFVPLHKGDWRRYNNVEIWSDGADLRMRLPIGAHPASWLTEVASDTSPMSTHEHDPALPATYGRRIWGLQLAAPAAKLTYHGEGPFFSSRALYGIVGLDRYKDYTLAWQDGKVTYPRVFIKPEQLDKYRQAMQASPLLPQLKKQYYCLSQDPAVARAHATQLKQALTSTATYMLSTPAMGHHHTYVWIAVMADDVLSWPELPAAEREDLRARLALVAYLHMEPDMMAHGTGTHTGNPNMGYARQSDMNGFMALLPDHPAYTTWRDYMTGFFTYKTGSFMAPGGGWFEYGAAYHQHSLEKTTRNFLGVKASGSTNTDQMYNYLRPELNYYMNLLTPYDSRWLARMIPGGGNSCPGYSEIYLEGMAGMEDRDSEFAANLRWAWEQNGMQDWRSSEQFNPLLGRPYIAAKEPKLGSLLIPGVGVIFRAHQGPDETYMYLRSGYLWSHWYVNDQGSFILYSKGAALVPFQPYQYYYSSIADFDQYNVMRFGAMENQYEMGWPDTNILDHAFGPTVDYAWSSTGYQEWYITPGVKQEFSATSPHRLDKSIAQTEGAFAWNRQVLFLKGETAKSPNYFVFRDTMPGDGKLANWFNMSLIGRKSDITTDGTRIGVNTEWPTKLDLLFAQKEPVKVDLKEEDQPLIAAIYNTPGWFSAAKDKPMSPHWVRADGKAPVADNTFSNGPDREQHVLLRMPGAPGQERFWVAYPRGEGEAAPKISNPAPGVMKIVTAESTDFVFLSPTPLTFEGEAVSFTGCAGSVRIKKSAVTLALTGGVGKVGYKGYVIQSETAFERTIASKLIRKGLTTLPAPASAVVYTPALQGHQPVAPGVSKAGGPEAAEYLINNTKPVSFTEGTVHIEARQGAVYTQGNTVRIVVKDRTYAKITVGAVGVRGVGPFDLTFTNDQVTGTVDGDIRTLVITRPQGIVRPMYHLDGVRWYAGFADDATPDDGLPTPQFNLALGLTAGKHTVEIKEWAFPAMPTMPARKALN